MFFFTQKSKTPKGLIFAKTALLSGKSVQGQTCRAELWGRYALGAGLFRKFLFWMWHVNNCFVSSPHNLSLTEFTSERHPLKSHRDRIWVMLKQAEECVPRRLMCSLFQSLLPTSIGCHSEWNLAKGRLSLTVWIKHKKILFSSLEPWCGAQLSPKCCQGYLMRTPCWFMSWKISYLCLILFPL